MVHAFDVLKSLGEAHAAHPPGAYDVPSDACNELLFRMLREPPPSRHRAATGRQHRRPRDARGPARGARRRHPRRARRAGTAARRRDDRDRRTADATAALAEFDAGRKAALARAVSIVENHRAGLRRLLAALHPRLGRARRIGITGPPGAGKSTLTTELARAYRAAASRSASSPSTQPRRSPAARCSAIAFAWRRSRSIPACSSARWRPAARSAASPPRRATSPTCWMPSASTA